MSLHPIMIFIKYRMPFLIFFFNFYFQIIAVQLNLSMRDNSVNSYLLLNLHNQANLLLITSYFMIINIQYSVLELSTINCILKDNLNVLLIFLKHFLYLFNKINSNLNSYLLKIHL